MQIRPHYALLGDGRLALHLRHYLGLLELPCSGWARNGASAFNTHHQSDPAQRLKQTIAPASHVLLLVSDSAIPELLRKYPFLHQHTLVHCAGALSLPGVAGAHPLMTFADQFYSLEQYQAIPFMVEESYDFDQVLPGLPNPSYEISVEDKARYHALCVMAGNFPQMLWQAVASRFEQQLQIPGNALDPYLKQVLANFLQQPEQALTGPLTRGDAPTITRNLNALEGDPLQALYEAFLRFYPSTHVESNAAPQVLGSKQQS